MALVRTDGDAEVCLVAYNLGKGELGPNATVLSEDGDRVPGGRIELRERTVTGIEGLDKLVATFQASGLEAGRYTLQLSLTDPETRTRQNTSIALRVYDGEGSSMVGHD